MYAGMLAGEVEGLCSRLYIFTHAVARSESVCLCACVLVRVACLSVTFFCRVCVCVACFSLNTHTHSGQPCKHEKQQSGSGLTVLCSY